jgi:RimJ/RimL family protein N-acetyltransferase
MASKSLPPLPAMTIEVAARSFHREAVGYGFGLPDFVHFTNTLLDIAMASHHGGEPARAEAAVPHERYADLPVTGPTVTIRRFGEPGDRQHLEDWVADAEGRFFLLSTTSGRTQTVEHLVQSPHNLIGIVTAEGRPVGCVAYLNHRPDQGRAELRKMIGERDMRGRGLAHEAAKLWLGYGLGALGLKKIYLTTLVTHVGNIKINEELGFRVEGVLRNEVFIDGRYHDVLRMGLWDEAYSASTSTGA